MSPLAVIGLVMLGVAIGIALSEFLARKNLRLCASSGVPEHLGGDEYFYIVPEAKYNQMYNYFNGINFQARYDMELLSEDIRQMIGRVVPLGRVPKSAEMRALLERAHDAVVVQTGALPRYRTKEGVPS